MSESDLPVQPSLRRLREHGVRPRRDLGQNFLVDSNILGVIERAADIAPAEGETASTAVALEIGGGLGVLTEHLAPRCAHVHVVELDRTLEAPLREAIAPFDNVTLHFADAMKLDLEGLDPPPDRVVANLPYGIAAGAILRTIEDLPLVTRWVAMVQKEVGERFAAGPGSDNYGVPSVLAQLSCDVKVLRGVSRTVFYPVPNVDSVLIVLDRRGPAPPPDVRRVVSDAFAHRRKALARSLSLAPDRPKEVRDQVREAVVALGHPADVRAERLSPQDFLALAAALSADAATTPEPA